MNHISSPLNLKQFLSKHSVNVSCIPFLDVLVIAFFITLLSSKFIFAPGMAIDLPTARHGGHPGTGSTAVISVNHTNMIFFEGQIVSEKNLLPVLKKHISESEGNGEHILLAKISKNANTSTFFNICEIAKLAGFSHIQLAVNTLGKKVSHEKG